MPDVVVLVTSREPLMVRGERLVQVPSLSAHEAERLFLERARTEAPDRGDRCRSGTRGDRVV